MKFTKIIIGGYILGLAVADKGIHVDSDFDKSRWAADYEGKSRSVSGDWIRAYA